MEIITHQEDHPDEFPKNFSIKLNELGQKFDSVFEKVFLVNKNDIDIYVLNENENPVKYDLKNEEKFEHYTEINGRGFVTLVRNSARRNIDKKFRIVCYFIPNFFLVKRFLIFYFKNLKIARIFPVEDFENYYDILPLNFESISQRNGL